MTKKRLLAFVKREALLLGGAAATAVTASLASGGTLSVALQSALPLAVAAALRAQLNGCACGKVGSQVEEQPQKEAKTQ